MPPKRWRTFSSFSSAADHAVALGWDCCNRFSNIRPSAALFFIKSESNPIVAVAVTSVAFRPLSEAGFAPPTTVVLPTLLLVIEAFLSTSTLLVAFVDNDSWGEHRPLTAGPGVTDHPGAVTLASSHVLIMLVKSGFVATDGATLRRLFFRIRIQDLPRHRGSMNPPVVSLSANSYSSISITWLISQLPFISTGRSPIHNPGMSPTEYSYPPVEREIPKTTASPKEAESAQTLLPPLVRAHVFPYHGIVCLWVYLVLTTTVNRQNSHNSNDFCLCFL